MKIGNITLKNNLILAPMAGVTDLAFRSLCIDAGADMLVSASYLHKDIKNNVNVLKNMF